MMFVSEFITDAPSAMPAEVSVLPFEPIKVDEVVRRIAVGIVFTSVSAQCSRLPQLS